MRTPERIKRLRYLKKLKRKSIKEMGKDGSVRLDKDIFVQNDVTEVINGIVDSVKENNYKNVGQIKKSWEFRIQELAHEYYNHSKEHRILFKRELRSLIIEKIY